VRKSFAPAILEIAGILARMAQAFIVTLERTDGIEAAAAAYEKGRTGKAVAREVNRLDSAARRKGVEPFTALLSESQAAVIEQMKEMGLDPTRMRVPPEQWFEAGVGLKTVRAVMEYVEGNLNDFKQPRPILRDLKAAEELLKSAEGAGVRFHFTNVNL
jgi:hypothetical protein